MTDAVLYLNDRARLALQNLQERFIFRKLGICYDYATTPEDFPRKTLPDARDAREGRPNRSGLGTGMAECAWNDALIFDGLLLRLELGLADAEDERIFDRMIGGLIRIATVAPKGALVRGLTPDGRGFYGESSAAAHLFWAFSAWRGFHTAAIAKESQDKIQNIAGRWISRLEQDGWAIRPLSGKSSPVDLTGIDWLSGPLLLALVSAARSITGSDRWQKVYEERWADAEAGRIKAPLPSPIGHPQSLLLAQVALHLLAANETDEARLALIQARAREIAAAAAGFLGRFAECKAQILEEAPDLDWRQPAASQVLAEAVEDGLRLPVAWRRIQHEQDTIRAASEAALAVLLARDRALAEAHRDAMAECLAQAPWERVWLASALTPVISVHARGLELGLWDGNLQERAYSFDGNANLVTPYLAEDFDERHPEKAGHTEAPPHKRPKPDPEPENREGDEGQDKSRSRQRRRRRGRRKR